jgi:poly(hydroxyalkanoate) depolymerase family esterase
MRPRKSILPGKFLLRGFSIRPDLHGEAETPPLWPGSFTSHRHTTGAGTLAYKLYVPQNAAATMPLVVMMHGCLQSPDDFAAGTRMNELAEQHALLVAYPAQSSHANSHKCWNWFNTRDQEREGREPSLVAGLTRRIIRDYPVDASRVFVAGLSAGGAAASVMGVVYPDLYAGAGIHSGLACGSASDVGSALAAMRDGASQARGRITIPTIVFHGDMDKVVHPVNGDQVMAQSAAPGLTTTVKKGRNAHGRTYTRTLQADQRGRTVREHWVLHGVGHAWSGGSAAGSYTEPHGPDASQEFTRFFLAL